MTRLERSSIPALDNYDIRIGADETSYRSFPTGKKKFFRRYQLDTLELELEFKSEFPNPVVILSTDLNSPRGTWQDLQFERIGPKRFTLSIVIERCGVFRFKVRYSKDGGASFNWLKGDYSYLLVDPLPTKVVRMYTMLPTVSGTVTDWKNQLEHVKSLNCDMVHCLPLTMLDRSESPYSAYDLFSIDDSYLDPSVPNDNLAQLEDFVETAKRLGIRLCFDLVINHIGVSSRMAQLRPDWLQHDEKRTDGIKRAGCWHNNEWISWEDLALINYDHPVRRVRKQIRQYMTEYVLFWSNYANYTNGMIRYDNLHSSHAGFIHEITLALRERFPNLIVLAEFFTDEEEFIAKVPDWSLNLLQANSWEYPFAPDLRNYIAHVHERRDQLKYLFSITTHDTETPAKRFAGVLSTVPRYFICALFSTGTTGLVQGVEYGQPEQIEFIGRHAKISYSTGEDFCEIIRRINELMAEYTVFQRGGNLRFIDDDHGAVVGAYRFSSGDEDEFVLFANLDISSEHDYWFDLEKHDVRFKQLVSMLDDEPPRDYTGSHFPLKLSPGGVKAYRLVK